MFKFKEYFSLQMFSEVNSIIRFLQSAFHEDEDEHCKKKKVKFKVSSLENKAKDIRL